MEINQLTTRRSLGKSFGSSFAVLVGVLLMGSVQSANAQYRYVPEHRRPIDATIHDLQEVAAHNPHPPGVQRRYDMAMRHLSDFGTELEHGVWNDRRLDQAIGDVRNVMDTAPIDQRGRDMLR